MSEAGVKIGVHSFNIGVEDGFCTRWGKLLAYRSRNREKDNGIGYRKVGWSMADRRCSGKERPCLDLTRVVDKFGRLVGQEAGQSYSRPEKHIVPRVDQSRLR